MTQISKQAFADFNLYPSVGQEDWRYAFACARVRVLESQLLQKSLLTSMAGSENFDSAVDMLTSTEYSLGKDAKNFAQIENMLLQLRTQTRELFYDLIIDSDVIEIFKARDDFANLKLAIRRSVTDKPIGVDYSDHGNVSAELFEHVFEQEDYSPLPMHMREAIERGVLAYYQQKDVKQIDYAIDNFQAEYQLEKADELNSVFLRELFRMQVDLANIQAMLRLKFTEIEPQDAFINGGYVDFGLLKRALNTPYEAIGAIFYPTPYQQVVEGGCHYFAANNSFLRLEHLIQDHVTGYLKSTMQIAAGPQPLIAYLLRKEMEIRTVRLILTAKKNSLDNRLILDRIGGR